MSFSFNPVRNKFTPRKGQTYRFIGVPSTGHPNLALKVGRRVWDDNKSDKARLAINNVFQTVGEAKSVRAKIVELLKSAQR